MNKAPIVILTLMMLSAGHAQETAKPLSEEALTRTIDAIGIGDPLTKQPLSIGDDMPRKEEPEKPEKKAKGDTEIIADSLTFDNRIHTAIFQGNVVVIDPEFNVKCDKLTAYLKAVDKSNGAASAKPAAKPAATPVSGKPEAPARGGGLEKAIAEMNGEGRVLITQDKVNADGTISRSIGRARKAVYDSGTGDITLTGMPSVQQGFNMQLATKEETVMILNRAGVMRAIGQTRTVISGSNNDSPGAGAGRKGAAKESSSSNLLSR